jgi:hypothetical protein
LIFCFRFTLLVNSLIHFWRAVKVIYKGL